MKHQSQHLVQEDQVQRNVPAQVKGRDRLGGGLERLNYGAAHRRRLPCRHRTRTSTYPLHPYIATGALSSFGTILVNGFSLRFPTSFYIHHVCSAHLFLELVLVILAVRKIADS